MKKYKLLACNVFQRELCALLANSPDIVDPEFLELGLHASPEVLREALQSRIDAASGTTPGGAGYDAILLGYGLCGNGLVGIVARSVPLVLPRAHDCCTILLGSRSEFMTRFGDIPSAAWTSAGYIERGTQYLRSSILGQTTGLGLEYAELVEKYGDENAVFIWETLHPELHETKLRFIEMPGTEGLGYADAMRERAKVENLEFELIPGSIRILASLIGGGVGDDFLVVPPGSAIHSAYDNEAILRAGEAP